MVIRFAGELNDKPEHTIENKKKTRYPCNRSWLSTVKPKNEEQHYTLK